MKKLKAVALSDLHLGEPEGLLYDSNDPYNAIQITVAKIRELARGGSDFDDGIEELILIGDIVDLSEAPAEEAFRNTRAFLSKLVASVDIDKIVYVPGNHDHHMWVELLKRHQQKNSYRECEPKTCVDIAAAAWFAEQCIGQGYPPGKVVARYPYYVLEAGSSLFFFDHGHLFSKTLERLTWPGRPKDLEELEGRTWRIMEKIWFTWTGRWREVLYDFVRRLTLHLKKPKRGTNFEEDSAPVYDDYTRSKIIWYLDEICKIQEEYPDAFGMDFHFVFGHSHHGGRVLKADRKIRIDGQFITAWNTGGWLVPSEVFSPDAYIFFIENTPAGVRPDAYKLVQQKQPTWVGDYPSEILSERSKHIG